MNAKAQPVRVESLETESTVETPRRVHFQGLARLANYFCGKEILILGPGSVGKSKFAQYLRLGVLDAEGKRQMTFAVTESPTFALGLGRDEPVALRVRRAVDTPGQVGPLQHALLVGRRKPHAVIVMLNCSEEPRNTLRWFCLFCDALDSVLRKVSSAARRLQEIVVLLNKRDKIDDREFAQLRQAVRTALERFLTVALGAERVRSIPLLECISVRTERGTALIDGVIAQLTERLVGRPCPPAPAPGPRLVAISPPEPPAAPARPASRPVPSPAPTRPSYRSASTPSYRRGHPPVTRPAT